MFDTISCFIPGASKLSQVTSNVLTSDLPACSNNQMEQIKEVYEEIY